MVVRIFFLKKKLPYKKFIALLVIVFSISYTTIFWKNRSVQPSIILFLFKCFDLCFNYNFNLNATTHALSNAILPCRRLVRLSTVDGGGYQVLLICHRIFTAGTWNRKCVFVLTEYNMITARILNIRIVYIPSRPGIGFAYIIWSYLR